MQNWLQKSSSVWFLGNPNRIAGTTANSARVEEVEKLHSRAEAVTVRSYEYNLSEFKLHELTRGLAQLRMALRPLEVLIRIKVHERLSGDCNAIKGPRFAWKQPEPCTDHDFLRQRLPLCSKSRAA
jgi:hypothetical protein